MKLFNHLCKAVALNLWGHDPFGGGVTCQISCLSDIHITIHNSRKITVMKSPQNNFMVGSQYTMRNCIKVSQH